MSMNVLDGWTEGLPNVLQRHIVMRIKGTSKFICGNERESKFVFG